MHESNIPTSKLPESPRFQIDVCNQTDIHVDFDRLAKAVREVLSMADVSKATISVAVVDDETIHGINREFLNHDYPTDVLSFPLERNLDQGILKGEILVSIETAAENAAEYQWSTDDELLLYVIHGSLHLIGYDDHNEADRLSMREAEVLILEKFDLRPPDAHQGHDALDESKRS